MTADELRATLRQLGLTQRAFAGLLKSSPATVQRWVQGLLPVPGYAEAYLSLYRKAYKFPVDSGE